MLRPLEGIENVRGTRWVVQFLTIVAIAWVPAQVASYSVRAVIQQTPGPDYFATPWRAVTAVILLAPILETLMMRFNFWALRKLRVEGVLLLWVSALIWGGMHVQSEDFGIPAIWAFFVFGAVYLRVEQFSKDRALLVTTAVHVAFNSLSYVLYLVSA
jgi:membrane protease YdiL (CAAX protease family)